VNKLGIPTYNELVLVANSDTLDSKSQDIRLFLDALQRGTEAAVADPAGATKDILDAGKGLDPKTTRAEVKKTLPLLAQKGAKRYGYMDPAQWRKFAQFFADNGVIKALPSPDDVLTNDLLPGTEQP
jgi:putative hydroxymethylpyrimidine transport system substrate-binding protein